MWCSCVRLGLPLAIHRRETYLWLWDQGLRTLGKKVIQRLAFLLPRSVSAQNTQYQVWLKREKCLEEDQHRHAGNSQEFDHKPLFSIILSALRVGNRELCGCIESILAQHYPHWQLIVFCDASTSSLVTNVVDKYRAGDSRISMSPSRGREGLASALNSALQLARGDFLTLVDGGDELSPNGLHENARITDHFPQADMIYSDEDMIDADGKRHTPYFKPDWSPDMHLSHPYTHRLAVYRTELVREAGGFRQAFDCCPEYDLVLRLTERTQHIHHLARVLYHSRRSPQTVVPGSPSMEVTNHSALRAVQEALDRRSEGGWVEQVGGSFGRYRVHYRLIGDPLISIMIPTRDLAGMLEKCLRSIFTKSTYPYYEVIVIDNGSTRSSTFRLFSEWRQRQPHRFQVRRLDAPFNFSRLNNAALRYARGQLLLFLNNDTEVITPDWLEEMASHALRRSTGAVGAKLLYRDHTIQHAGIFLGFGGVAGHMHRCCYGNSPGYFGRLLANYNCSAITGACMMVRRDLFEAVGGFDEDLAVTLNDVDFCLKLLTRGLYNVVLPHVELYHHESKSRGFDVTGSKQERFQREIDLVLKRWPTYFANDPFYNPNLTQDKEDFSIRA
jgi:O-antigen biosynthesis protein